MMLKTKLTKSTIIDEIMICAIDTILNLILNDHNRQ